MFTVIMGNGKMDVLLDMDNKIIMSKVYIKVILLMVKKLEKDYIYGIKEEASMMEIFKMA